MVEESTIYSAADFSMNREGRKSLRQREQGAKTRAGYNPRAKEFQGIDLRTCQKRKSDKMKYFPIKIFFLEVNNRTLYYT